MTEEEVRGFFTMPADTPAYPRPPVKFVNREFIIITYRTDDCLVGTLDYSGVRVATATMAYKYAPLDTNMMKKSLEAPGFLLKVIPHVDGSPRICELVKYRAEDVTVKGAWSGPASLELHPHALASLANLPVLEVLSAVHIVSDLSPRAGEIAHDYLSSSTLAKGA